MSGISQINKKIRIISFPRIHLTLIGMNSDGYRINGSVGFSVSIPIIDSYFEETKDIEIIDNRELKFTNIEKERLEHLIAESKIKYEFKKGIKCRITTETLPHYGLGSSTAIYMSCIEALFLINNAHYDPQMIISLSKRGRTSGVGINTYFEGGFVFDVGIKSEEQMFAPSSIADRSGKMPLVLHKCKLPNWKVGICVPKYISNKTEQEEIDFFKTNCPIDKSYINDILHEAVYGITSSIIENDYDTFCKSVNSIQLTQWKYLERSLYGNELTKLEQKIKYDYPLLHLN